ncbi:MAG TPA: nitroreductase family protein, partial [Thermohalobaculum sp.]|nr:nitroreductase family protein [Thermohalobaculum sp.]
MLEALLRARYGSSGGAAAEGIGEAGKEAIARLLDRRACRAFAGRPVPEALVRLIAAAGLAAPTKSDLQQADVIWCRDRAVRAAVQEGAGEWVGQAPVLLVVCADGARFAGLFEGRDFPNDHFDAAFNAIVDAAIVLEGMVAASALAGLGTCPVSVIRNRARAVADALALPDRVIPVAGLALGWQVEPRAAISPRLALEATFHVDRYDRTAQAAGVADLDRRRIAVAPYASQRAPERFGTAETYGWSEDKRRQ